LIRILRLVPPDSPASSNALRALRIVGYAAAFGLCVLLFYDARALNGGYLLPRQGTMSVPGQELVFYVWYALYGTLATLFLALLSSELRLAPLASRALSRVLARADVWVYALALACFSLSLAFRKLVLLDQPVADDESTYIFIARTLLAGRLTNPIPEDREFFTNQFVVMNAHGWHGKYPIGHPLVLALGEALGAAELVVPLIGALCVVLTYRVGRRVFDARSGLIGAALLLLSPHFVWTCATMLSQPTACASMLLGMLALLRAVEDGRLRWAGLSGAAFGFGVLVRPLPGIPFALVALCVCLAPAWRRELGFRTLARRLAALGGGALPFVLAALVVNVVQSGSPFHTGYHDFHKTVPLMPNAQGEVSNSLGGALIRENFWLLGWTFALSIVPFARPARASGLFWGMIAAELAYRVIAPKTVVSVTGPTYLTEIVPLLVLAVVSGADRIGRFAADSRVRALDVALAASITSACMFAPLQVGALLSGAETRQVVYLKLEDAGADQALVFTNSLAAAGPALTWAYYPDNPSPELNDRWLFVRVPVRGEARARMLEFWQRRFPERRAFVYYVNREGDVQFSELTKPR
jgi:hypothetical protein